MSLFLSPPPQSLPISFGLPLLPLSDLQMLGGFQGSSLSPSLLSVFFEVSLGPWLQNHLYINDVQTCLWVPNMASQLSTDNSTYLFNGHLLCKSRKWKPLTLASFFPLNSAIPKACSILVNVFTIHPFKCICPPQKKSDTVLYSFSFIQIQSFSKFCLIFLQDNWQIHLKTQKQATVLSYFVL